MMKERLAWLVIVVLLLVTPTLQQGEDLTKDQCLNGSIALQLVNNVQGSLNPGGATQFVLSEPKTMTEITNLFRNLYNTMNSASSPWANNLAVAFPSNSTFGIQSCNPSTAPCNIVPGEPFYAYIVSESYFKDKELRAFRIGDRAGNFYFNLSNVAGLPFAGYIYQVVSRPWWNASNTWSIPYEFYVGRIQSRTYVSQPSPTTGARIYADRKPDEPCDSCLSRSPCIALANYVADDAPFQTWMGTNNLTAIQAIFKWMYLRYMIPWQLENTVNSVGIGFSNQDFYLITDCYASPINATIPECQNGATHHLAEVRNSAVFGDQCIHAFNFTSENGDTTLTSRNESLLYPTTDRPWYKRGEGWTDLFPFVNTATGTTLYSRTYARWFYGGVIAISTNPNKICIPARAITPSPASRASGFMMDLLSLLY